ncbi:hypothetical protein ACWEKM_18310 [Streptomyces sp. NPDC004752]
MQADADLAGRLDRSTVGVDSDHRAHPARGSGPARPHQRRTSMGVFRLGGLLELDDATAVRRLNGHRQWREPLGFGVGEIAVLVTAVVWLVRPDNWLNRPNRL